MRAVAGVARLGGTMIERFLDGFAWLIKKLGLAHALELDHSPSRSLLGGCPCKGCSRVRALP